MVGRRNALSLATDVLKSTAQESESKLRNRSRTHRKQRSQMKCHIKMLPLGIWRHPKEINKLTKHQKHFRNSLYCLTAIIENIFYSLECLLNVIELKVYFLDSTEVQQ